MVGLRALSGGALLINGHDVSRTTARAIRLLGVAHIPEDRHRRGLVLPMAVWENVILGHHYRKEFTNGPLLNRPTIDDLCAAACTSTTSASPTRICRCWRCRVAINRK